MSTEVPIEAQMGGPVSHPSTKYGIAVDEPSLGDSARYVQLYNISVRERMRSRLLIFCAMLFVGALFVSDATTMKLVSYNLAGLNLLFPAGTFAFAITFLATDVMCEVTGDRRFANRVVAFALIMRVFAFGYYHFAIGDAQGNVIGLSPSNIWTPDKQEHLRFVLGATSRIEISGLISATVAFLIDTYVFNRLRQLWINKNRYWFRNGITTTISQVVNSTIFISIAFGDKLSLDAIAITAIGQIFMKILFAWLDTPLALLMRNYGQGRRFWYAPWRKDFYLG